MANAATQSAVRPLSGSCVQSDARKIASAVYIAPFSFVSGAGRYIFIFL